MRRCAVIFMLLGVVGLSTGSLDYAHQRQHQQQTADWLAAVRAIAVRHGQKPAVPPVPLPASTAANCSICQLLHFPSLLSQSPSTLAVIGLLALAIALCPEIVFARRLCLPIFLRGPP